MTKHMPEGEPKGPEQSQSDFSPTEKDWEDLIAKAGELIDLQKGIEEKYNYHPENSSYQDFRLLLQQRHYMATHGKRDPVFFEVFKKHAEAWKDYLTWLSNNEAFREAEFYRQEQDKDGWTLIGYFPEIRRPELIFGKLGNAKLRQEGNDKYHQEWQITYGGDGFLRYIDLSRKEFEKLKEEQV
jgi:hypothetical protein